MSRPGQLVEHYRQTADVVIAELRRHPKVTGIAICGSLVERRIIREDRRRAEIEGVPLVRISHKP